MRLLTMCALLTISLTSPALADEFVVRSKIVSAVVNPDGARLTRAAIVTVPAGQHVIVIPDLPASIEPGSFQVSFDQPGVRIEAMGLRVPGLYPAVLVESDAERAAKQKLDAAPAALRDLTFQKRSLEAEAESARAQIDFLK